MYTVLFLFTGAVRDNSINNEGSSTENVNNNSSENLDRPQESAAESGESSSATNDQQSSSSQQVQMNIPVGAEEDQDQGQNEDNIEKNIQGSPMDTTQSSEPPSTPAPQLSADQKKFLQFAETHRVVLNQILRQSSTHLADGPFAVLVDHTRVLDFDVKRRYFRIELERLDDGIRREELAVHVHRANVFEDSFRELYRRNPEEWKNRFYIVFEDEEGQDAGGLLREWYMIISREIFNPMYALFTVAPGDRVTYMINPSSHYNPNHLCYFKFVGRVIGKFSFCSCFRVMLISFSSNSESNLRQQTS